ncbi:LOG family protein [Luteococcus sp. Sow4_B9]|uniref:LOG family protein n=1 Tax=Luteococcus sp. Sow4_B9 TaxID=3438792 RepID=UPI003F95D1A5
MMTQAHEIETLEAFDRHCAAGLSLSRCILQSLDLTGRGAVLADTDVHGAIFLGCHLPQGSEVALRHRGALIFPRLPSLPFNPYQPHLYEAEELFDAIVRGEPHDGALDARIYAWHQAQGPQPSLGATLATSLHDHSISDALDEWCHSHPSDRAIGIMGGHAAARGTDEFRAAARLAGSLTRAGRLVMTGGGPGAMEAANLGAYLAHQPEVLDEAIDILTAGGDFRDDITSWARATFEVRSRWQASGESVGIPTWFYGHEPPNGFASVIAKYFSNAIREDTLLQRCRGGIVYLHGAAGTVQEIFQAATGNYYAADGEPTTPMVLVGREHWTHTLPAWPLLEALGRDRAMGTRLHLVDDIEEAVEVLLG